MTSEDEKDPLVSGKAVGYLGMLQAMMEDLCAGGGLPVGLALFGSVDGRVDVYIGGDGWPDDVDTLWPQLVAMLEQTVKEAQRNKARLDAAIAAKTVDDDPVGDGVDGKNRTN